MKKEDNVNEAHRYLETKILVVDDDKAVRDFLGRFLKTAGYTQIFLAADGQEALDAIKKDDIRLVLLDIKLPGMNGIEVLKKIKEINKNIGVIMITGFPDESLAEEAMKQGAYDYIVKPFDLAYLKLSVLTKIVSGCS
jgi:DNA-binding NtrC family response regulator